MTSLGPAANAGVIIDLRDTADGSPEEGIAAARPFVKASGVLATKITRNAPPAVARAAMADGTLGMKVVLVVSNGTGKGAEVFAAALANNHRADLVGEPTAGMASAQRLVKLAQGHGLLLTTERYVQADASPLDGRGLRPTVIVETPTVDFGMPGPATDVTLARAIDVLRGKPPSPAPAAPATPAVQTPTNTPPGGGRPALPPTTPPQDPQGPR
jgi:carboxyl-terminal processing protease